METDYKFIYKIQILQSTSWSANSTQQL